MTGAVSRAAGHFSSVAFRGVSTLGVGPWGYTCFNGELRSPTAGSTERPGADGGNSCEAGRLGWAESDRPGRQDAARKVAQR